MLQALHSLWYPGYTRKCKARKYRKDLLQYTHLIHETHSSNLVVNSEINNTIEKHVQELFMFFLGYLFEFHGLSVSISGSMPYQTHW